MNVVTFLTILAVLVCVGLVGFFAGAETGVVSVNRVHLRHSVRSGNAQAQRLSRLLVRQEGVIAALLIGTNVFNVAAAALATALFQKLAGSAGAALSTAVMTPIIVLFAEVIPKTYFRQRADAVMPRVYAPLAAANRLLSPFAWLTSQFVRLMFRMTGHTQRQFFVTREELKSIVRESAEKGALRLRERDMLHGVFDFGRTAAREVMIPLGRVTSLPVNATADELKDLVRAAGHTRVLVHGERAEDVVGFVNIFDVLYSERQAAGFAEHVRPIRRVQAGRRLDGLLIELLRARAPIAAVYAEDDGECVGIVTVEDIVEEIMGELADEHEPFVSR
ncbi:MAG: HlyC/CorC family transporter [Candidatus Eisenbacteria bacterium]|nr:HlyC/CorC family transporter [Candidatus Eisenbacteria bacterium]